MANTFFKRRTVVLLALVVISVIMGKAGHPTGPGNVFGMWDGPI